MVTKQVCKKNERFSDIADATRRRERMGAVTIEQSVGFGGRNKPIDVAIIQRLLKAYFTEVATPVKGRSSRVITPSIAVDGECTTGLVDLIKDVQSDDMGVKHPDGRIDPYGKTLQTITSALHCTAGDAKTILFGPAPGNTDILPKVDAGRFRKLFPRQIGEGLTITKGEDLLGFFGFLQKDTAINGYPVGSLHARNGLYRDRAIIPASRRKRQRRERAIWSGKRSNRRSRLSRAQERHLQEQILRPRLLPVDRAALSPARREQLSKNRQSPGFGG